MRSMPINVKASTGQGKIGQDSLPLIISAMLHWIESYPIESCHLQSYHIMLIEYLVPALDPVPDSALALVPAQCCRQTSHRPWLAGIRNADSDSDSDFECLGIVVLYYNVKVRREEREGEKREKKGGE